MSEQDGINWWNAMTEAERRHWLRVADSAVPADAWAAYLSSDFVVASEIPNIYTAPDDGKVKWWEVDGGYLKPD